jgi:hypothetical protein
LNLLATALRGLQLVLVAVCALLLYAIVAPHLSAAPPLRDVELRTAAEPESSPLLDYYGVVWKQNPFGKPRKELGVVRQARILAKMAEASKLSWRLVTTAAATPPELSVAGLVSTKDGSRRMIRVGDQLADRKVVEIERRRVIFSHNGKFEQLTIEGVAPRPLARAKPRRSSAARVAGARPVRGRRGASRTPSPAEPATPPQTPLSGQLAGAFADRIDLAPGEEIVAVNGRALDDVSLGELASEGGEVVVQIRGANGTEREVVLEASQ